LDWTRSDAPQIFVVTALSHFGAGILIAAAGLGAGVAWPWIAAVAGVLVCAGLLRWARAAVDLGRRRRAADDWLPWGAAVRSSSPLRDWRARELTSARARLTLARSLRGIERELRGASLPGPVSLKSRALRHHAALVRALQGRLDDTSLPVSARGTVLTDRLLTAPGSPLYSPAPGDVLAQALTEALAALDV
jgi:hypothetical protein